LITINEGNGASVRGRAGYRGTRETIRTIPPTVKVVAGDGGQTVKVVANYFRLTTPKDVIVYDYHVDFEPQIEARVMRKALLFTHKEAFGESLVYDNMSNLKSTTLLPNEETEFFSTRKTDNAQIR
jgi:hypothetical protein